MRKNHNQPAGMREEGMAEDGKVESEDFDENVKTIAKFHIKRTNTVEIDEEPKTNALKQPTYSHIRGYR
jgi:aminoglycoside phosphotransferase family enzyme